MRQLVLLLALVSLVVSGCERRYDFSGSHDAVIEAKTTLDRAGIKNQMQRAGAIWQLKVDHSDYLRAQLTLRHQLSAPGGQLTADLRPGPYRPVATLTESTSRFDKQLAERIVALVKATPGIVDAWALVTSEAPLLADSMLRRRAFVMATFSGPAPSLSALQQRITALSEDLTPQVTKLILRPVVTRTVRVPSTPLAKLGPFTVAAQSRTPLAVMLSVLVAALITLSVLLIVVVLRRRQERLA